MPDVEWLMRGQRGTWITHSAISFFSSVISGLITGGVASWIFGPFVGIIVGKVVAVVVSWAFFIAYYISEKQQLEQHVVDGHNIEVWRDDFVGDLNGPFWIALSLTIGVVI